MPKSQSGFQLLLISCLKVNTPEIPKMRVEGELELSGATVKRLILDALEEDGFKN